MKKNLTVLTILIFSFSCVIAQVRDTVSMGAGYVNTVWYDIENDVETKASATSWDIALAVRPLDAAIQFNPNNPFTFNQSINSIINWASVGAADTAKLTKPLYNGFLSWSDGAFNATKNLSDPFDYGWANYNQATKNVTGDSVFIIKTIKGDWKKIAITSLKFDTTYFIRYANLDGTNEKNLEIKKTDYPKKNFVYLSLSDDKISNPEPDNDKWDILFTKYHGIAPNPSNGVLTPYTLIGAFQNNVLVNERGVFKFKGATAVKVTRKEIEKDDFDQTKLSNNINTIGSEWKTFTGTSFVTSDSTTFFVKNRNAKFFKLNFKSFGGAANGNFIFDKKALLTLSVKDVINGTASLAIYPNPSNGSDLTLVYDLGKNAQKVDFQLVSLSGQVVYAQKLQITEGVQYLTLPSLNLTSGLYFAVMRWNGQSVAQKVIIK